jgi:hypothetical protein
MHLDRASMEYKLSDSLIVREGHQVKENCWICIEPFGCTDKSAPWEIFGLDGRRKCHTPHPVHLACLQRMLYHKRMEETPVLHCGVCRGVFQTNCALPSPYAQVTEEKLHIEYRYSTQRRICMPARTIIQHLNPQRDEKRLERAM